MRARYLVETTPSSIDGTMKKQRVFACLAPFLFVFVSAVALVLPPSGVGASERKDAVSAKTTFGWRRLGPTYVQFRPIMAPIKTTRGKVRNGPVTVVLALNDNSLAGKVCRNAPRVNHALLTAWYKKPVEWSFLYKAPKEGEGATKIRFDRTPEEKQEEQRLIDAVNGMLDGAPVTHLVAFLGAKPGAKGGLSRLPFSSRCTELESQEKAAEKAAAEHGGH